MGILGDWQSTLSALAAGITALGVIAAVVAVRLGWTQVKELKASRQAIVTLDISRRWDEPELVECRKLMAGDPEQLRAQVLATGNNPDRDAYYVLTREPNFFEDLAIMVNRGALDFAVVKDGYGEMLIDRWNLWSLTVTWWRAEEGSDGAYRHFEALAKRMAEALA